MSAAITVRTEKVEENVVWSVVDRKFGERIGDFGALVLENTESGEQREIPVLELRSAGSPGFGLQSRYAQSAFDGIFHAVR